MVIGMSEKGIDATIVFIVVLSAVVGAAYMGYPAVKDKLFPEKKTINTQNNNTGSNTDPVPIILVNGQKKVTHDFRVGEIIHFNGSDSYDKDEGDEIIYYEWTFGDGTVAKNVSYDKNYTKAGEYTVTLLVADRNGGEGTASVNITVKLNDMNQTTTTVVHKGIFISLSQLTNQSFTFEALKDAQNATVNMTITGGSISGSASIYTELVDPDGITIRHNDTDVMGTKHVTYFIDTDEMKVGDYTLNIVCNQGTANINIDVSVRY